MSAQEEVLAAERAWLQAHRELDVDQLERLMHPDYRSIRPNGAVWDKARTLLSYRDGGRRWELAEISDLEIHVFGSAVRVIGLWRAKGENAGQAFDYSARYVSVWVRGGEGGWHLLHDQSQSIEEFT